MRIPLLGQQAVGARGRPCRGCSRANRSLNLRGQRLPIRAGHHAGHGLPPRCRMPRIGCLSSHAGFGGMLFLRGMLVFCLPPHVRFVNLDQAGQQHGSGLTRFAKAVQHVPGRVLLYLQFFAQLHRGDTLAIRQQEIGREEPLAGINLVPLQGGVRKDREVGPAHAAPVRAGFLLGRHLVGLVALGAIRRAVPTDLLEVPHGTLDRGEHLCELE